jgi:hypothetical protein
VAVSVARLAGPYRRTQALLAARMVQRVVRAWRELVDPVRVDASWEPLRDILAAEVRQARQASEALAKTTYQRARQAAEVPDDGFTPPDADPLDLDRLRARLEVTGPVAFKEAIAAGKSPREAIDAAAVRMAGSMQYLTLEGGRQAMQKAIEEDERATGWSRVTDEDPCAWCAMLASRGPVYKSAVTAGDPRQGGNRYHDHCGCTAWPAFTLDEPFVGLAEDLYQQWREHTRGHGGRDAVNAFRRWWETEGRAAYRPPERS